MLLSLDRRQDALRIFAQLRQLFRDHHELLLLISLLALRILASLLLLLLGLLLRCKCPIHDKVHDLRLSVLVLRRVRLRLRLVLLRPDVTQLKKLLIVEDSERLAVHDE